MNRSEHLLTCLSEECAEVAHRVSKALRFGLLEIQPGQPFTNAQRIQQELIDLIAVAEMLSSEGVLSMTEIDETIDDAGDQKQAKVEEFLAYAAKMGTLTT